MKISTKAVIPLGRLICGDSGRAPYLTGQNLVNFYNQCGFKDEYGEGFPSRWKYSSDKIAEANGTEKLKTILEEFVDPRRFEGNDIAWNLSVQNVNEVIQYDGYKLVKKGKLFRIVEEKGDVVNAESIKNINHDFVSEQIEKCLEKLETKDYNGAITNARTLVEAVLIHAIEELSGEEVKNDGNVLRLWKQTKKILKLEIDKKLHPDFIFQIITGIDTTLNGLAALSNSAGDRHANKFKPEKHHAKLAVNASMTICDFVIDVLKKRLNE